MSDEHLTDIQIGMRDKYAARLERYTVEVVERWPPLTSIETLTFLGNYSWTMANEGHRILYGPQVVDVGWGEQTPGEVVRDYLDIKYPNRLRATSAQIEAIRQHRSFPCMARYGEISDAVYFDLKSAYWSVLQVVGWDVDYFPGKFLGVSSSVLDFPLHAHKGARSGLVTAGLSNPIRFWTGSALGWKTAENKHINYGIWALVQDVLHGVAADMVRIGAQYVHTDGYILPASSVTEAIEVVQSWGLTGGVKARGHAKIFGVGVYQVGDVKTKRAKALPAANHYNINPVLADWLRPRFVRWSERTR